MNKSIKVAVLAAVTVVSMAAISVTEVNSKISALLAPFNTKASTASLTFTDLNIDAVKTLDFGLKGLYWRVGSENELAINVENASYHYGDGSNPRLDVRLTADFNIVKAFGQDTVNDMAEGLADMVEGMAQSYTEKYGEAITFDVAMKQIVKDQNGNVVSAKMSLTATLDFTKLPANLPSDEVEFKSFQLAVDVSQTNILLAGSVVMNPQYKAFHQDQDGLKEYIEALLYKNTYDRLAELFSMVDDLAKEIVEKKAEP